MIKKSTVLYLFFGIILLFCNRVHAQQDTLILDKIVATVGNNPIFLSDIENQYLQAQARGMTYEGDPKCQIFEDLLIQKLLLNQSQIDSIQVGDNDVDNELNQRLETFIRQIGSQEKLEEYFKKSLPEIKEDLRDVIKDQILTQKMQGKITSDIKITPTEVQGFFKSLPVDSLPIIDAEYELMQVCQTPKISDAEKLVVKKRLEEMREKIVKGGNFAAMARLYSEDPGSATKGGELGFMGRGELVPEFSSAAFILQVDSVSPVIETEFGYHIIQLIERRGERINVRHILMIPKVSYDVKSKSKARLDSICNEIRKNTVSFEEAALRFSDDENTRKNGGLVVNPQTGNSRFLTSQIDASTNYVIKNLNINEISNSFEDVDEKGKTLYKIVKIKSKSKPHTANLKDDYQKIHDMALNAKRNKEMDKWVASKQKASYIKIDNSYKNCTFKHKGWLK